MYEIFKLSGSRSSFGFATVSALSDVHVVSDWHLWIACRIVDFSNTSLYITVTTYNEWNPG